MVSTFNRNRRPAWRTQSGQHAVNPESEPPPHFRNTSAQRIYVILGSLDFRPARRLRRHPRSSISRAERLSLRRLEFSEELFLAVKSCLRRPLNPGRPLRVQTFEPERRRRRGLAPPRRQLSLVPFFFREGVSASGTSPFRQGRFSLDSCELLVFLLSEREPSSIPGPGRRCSRAGKTWSEKPPATPRIQLPHGSSGALEAAGVLRAANQPGDAGGEDPCRGYPLRGVGAGDARWTPGLLLLIYFF